MGAGLFLREGLKYRKVGYFEDEIRNGTSFKEFLKTGSVHSFFSQIGRESIRLYNLYNLLNLKGDQDDVKIYFKSAVSSAAVEIGFVEKEKKIIRQKSAFEW